MPYNILLVDDSKEFREELREVLEDYRIVEASCGEEAIGVLKKPNEIDLVILDEVMPDMRGTEVLKKIKEMAPDIGIIILTGHSSKDVAIEALKAHADDFVEKPPDIDELIESIEDLLDSKEKKEIDINDISGKIERVKHFIQRNWHKRICLEDASKLVGFSPKYLSRIFKEHTGDGFNNYVLCIKIDKAKGLLKESSYNINQISDMLGYQNVESFIRIFSKFAKKTPTAYRQSHKRAHTRKRCRTR